MESLDNTDVYTPTISRLAQLVVVDILATLTLQRRDKTALDDLDIMKSRLSRMRSGRQHEAVEAQPEATEADGRRGR